MDPYVLIVTGSLGSVVVPLGTEAAKDWRVRYARQLENPLIAELRPTEQDSKWPTLRLNFPFGSTLAFSILTQGILSTSTGVKKEFKTYQLGWVLDGHITLLCAREDRTVTLEYREIEEWQQQ